MTAQPNRETTAPPDHGAQEPQGGMPGDGAGRTETPGRSGVYPVSDMQNAGDQAKVEGEESFGQGKRGEAGYKDHGDSELTKLGAEETGGRT